VCVFACACVVCVRDSYSGIHLNIILLLLSEETENVTVIKV
jgi:hypothetical protein